MSETDNGTSEAPEPTVEPAEKPKVFSSGKPSFKHASPSKAEVIPDILPDADVLKIRTSLEQDQGFTANTMPTSHEATIRVWAAIVTKTGTFADAFKALGD